MILAKWGGSLLTNKAGRGRPRFQAATARRLAREWSAALGRRPGALVHGAGSFGHPQVLRLGVGTKEFAGRALREACIEVRASLAGLQNAVVNALRDAGLPAVAVPASTVASAERGRIRFRPAPFLELLDHGFHPVTGGDVVFDDRLGLRVLSGDELLVHLARALQPDRAVFATDVDGVLVERRLLLDLPPAAARAVVARIGRGRDATGGMRGKVEEARALQRLGVETWIVNGRRPGRFEAAVRGRPGQGTRFPPAGRI